MTYGQLADMIIVCSFFAIIGSLTAHFLAKGIYWLIGKTKAHRKNHTVSK